MLNLSYDMVTSYIVYNSIYVYGLFIYLVIYVEPVSYIDKTENIARPVNNLLTFTLFTFSHLPHLRQAP